MTTTVFGITYDYLCPFARNANEHVLAGIAGGAAWDVDFVPLSLTQLKSAESGTPRWDGPGALRRSGVLALAVAEVVRVHRPERFIDVHRELFALRHDRGEDLRDPNCIAGALDRIGVESALVDSAPEGLERLHATHDDLVRREVWGVPTLLGTRRAAFVRVLDRPTADAGVSVARISRLLELLEGEPMLHEFKQVDLPI